MKKIQTKYMKVKKKNLRMLESLLNKIKERKQPKSYQEVKNGIT